jgi:hypothetical protein
VVRESDGGWIWTRGVGVTIVLLPEVSNCLGGHMQLLVLLGYFT